MPDTYTEKDMALKLIIALYKQGEINRETLQKILDRFYSQYSDVA